MSHDVKTVLTDVLVRTERPVVVIDPESDAPGRTVMVPDQIDLGTITMTYDRALTADECHLTLLAMFDDVVEVLWTDVNGIAHVRGAP